MTPEACLDRLEQKFDDESFVNKVDRGQRASISLKMLNY